MCGIFGIYQHPEASNLTYLGLHALQHRGQESAGISNSDGRRVTTHRGMGLVADVFQPNALAKLAGPNAIGHVRYPTTGESHLRNAQPIFADYYRGSISIAHNGNLTNADQIKRKLEEAGSIFLSNSDTEVLVHLIAHSKAATLSARVKEALQQVQGSYSLVCLSEREMIVARDPYGWRPLVMGRIDGAYVFASEECAFDLIGATKERDVAPGEMLILSANGESLAGSLRSEMITDEKKPRSFCLFEHVYFARPDGILEGQSVYMARKKMGQALAQEHPATADVVIPVPDSGVPAAMGYAAAMTLPYELGLIRNHYVGRTFIEPKQSIRHFGVRLKLNAQKAVLEGKRVAVIDDSIVRGTTSKKIVAMIRSAGAKEVHMRIASPPVEWPCYFGINTPTKAELIASSQNIKEMCEFIGADSLGFLSLEGLKKAAGGGGVCDACFTGKYRVLPSL